MYSTNQSSNPTRAASQDYEPIVDDTSEPELKKPARRTSRKVGTKASKNSNATPVWQRPRGRGKLKMLPEMPIDILFEIFSRLNPSDILHLCRTTKALRSILLSRAAITVWRAALTHEPELPDLPTNMNEPQWASLLFSDHCHYCCSSGEYAVLWAFYARCCNKCMKEHFGQIFEVLTRMAGKLIVKYPGLLLTAVVNQKPRGLKQLASYADARSVNRQLAQLKNDKDGLEAFIKKRQDSVASIRQFSDRCTSAMELRSRRLLRESREAQEARRQRIFRRLEDLGFGQEIKRLNEVNPVILSEHPSIKNTKELTDRVWRNILPALVELMEETREKILKKQRKTLIRKRLRLVAEVLENYVLSRPLNEALPGCADICSLPNIKAMLEDSSSDAHITSSSFADLREQLPQICDEWLSSKNTELLALMSREGVDTHNGRSDFSRLELATTFFKCSDCIEPIGYPRILAHACLRTLRLGNRNRDDDTALIFSSLDSEPWNFGRGKVSYFGAAEASAGPIIEECGLNVDVATVADLNGADQWLECLICTHSPKGREAFKWQKAILHDMNHRVSENRSAKWKLLNRQDADLAQKQEAASYSSHRDQSPDFVCVRCRAKVTFTALKSHMLFEHNLRSLNEEDYHLHVDAAIQPTFSVVIPLAPSKHDVIDLMTPPPTGPEHDAIHIDDEENSIYV